MRFLIDQDVYHFTVVWLREEGHDILTAKELRMSRADDDVLLRQARERNRIFLTRDKDFGALVFLQAAVSKGVIFLRMTPADFEEVHQQLRRLLREHVEKSLVVLADYIGSDNIL